MTEWTIARGILLAVGELALIAFLLTTPVGWTLLVLGLALLVLGFAAYGAVSIARAILRDVAKAGRFLWKRWR